MSLCGKLPNLDQVKLQLVNNISILTDSELFDIINLPTIYCIYRNGDLDDRLVVLQALEEINQRIEKGELIDKDILEYSDCLQTYLQRFRKVLKPATTALVGDTQQDEKIIEANDTKSKKIDCLELRTPPNVSNSCYLNSTLWALLHKVDNPFLKFILESPLDENDISKREDNDNCNNERLREFLAKYYDYIHDMQTPKEITEFNFKKVIIDIREFLQNCVYAFPGTKYSDIGENKYWINKQQDNSEFLFKVINAWTKNPSSPQKILEIKTFTNQNNNTKFVPKLLDNAVPVLEFPADSFNKMTIEIEKGAKAQTMNCNLVFPIEILEPANYPTFYNVIYTSVQDTYKLQNLDYLIININRTGYDRVRKVPTKNKTTLNIPMKIASLELISVIVHIGESTDSGHYVCYFKCNGQWFIMDDMASIANRIRIADLTKGLDKELFTRNSKMLVYY